MRKRKSSLVLGIFLLALALGIGYAYLTTTLTINGVTDVDSNTWNVYWNNPVVTEGSVTGTQVTTPPTIDTNKTAVSYRVRLSKPGDYYEFTIDAKNDGTIDAMIASISNTINGGTAIPAYLKYSVTYDDGVEVGINHLLEANTTQTYKIKVEYRTDINASDLPSTPQSLTMVFDVEYIQADNNAIEKPFPTIPSCPGCKFIYTTSSIYYDDAPVPSGYVFNEDYTAVERSTGKPIFLGVKIENDKIVKGYVCGIKQENPNKGTPFCLEGSLDGSTFNSNKAILKSIYGDECKDPIYPNDPLECFLSNMYISTNQSASLISSSATACNVYSRTIDCDEDS